MSCGVGHRRGWNLALLWLGAPIWPLAWEPPYAASAALKRQKDKKKKKKKKKKKQKEKRYTKEKKDIPMKLQK